MKRLALALTAAVLGTACGTSSPPCPPGDLSVSWSSGFDGPDAVAGRPCGGAGVSYVDIFLDGTQVIGPVVGGHFACGDYGEVIAQGASARSLTVEGIASDGSTIKYRAERSIAAGCGNLAVQVAPAAGFVDFEYLFFTTGTVLPDNQQVCAGPWLWLSVFDVTANRVTVLADANNFPQSYACGAGTFISGSGYPLIFSLPTGNHVLQWMEERGPATSFTLQSADCTHRPFAVGPAATTSVPVDLDTASGVCPG